VGWRSSKRGLSQIWLQVKGKGKPVIYWQQWFLFFDEVLQLGESFLRKCVCVGGVGVEMILFVILGICSPLLEIKIIKIDTSGPKHFLGQQSWFSHCDVTTKKTQCELYKGFFFKKN